MSEYAEKRVVAELTDIRHAIEDLVDACKMLARVIAPDRAEAEIIRMALEQSKRDEREAAEKYGPPVRD